MSASTAAIEIQFDDTQAATYLPHRVVKIAKLMQVADGVETTIVPEWGGEQKFIGSWYAILDDDGNVKYGSARLEFDETHECIGEDTYVKITPIKAYIYTGESATVVTTLADGTRETENTVTNGDWLVKWPHGEIGVMKDEKFRKLYDVK